jgi:periplasmic protein TonB
MIGLAAEDLADLRRWAISGAVVVLVHGGIAAAMVTWHDPIEPDEAAGAVVIEFAPVPVAPAAEQTEVPPGPEMVMSDASPKKESPEDKEKDQTEQKVEAKLEQKVEEKAETDPVEEPPPEVAPAPNPEVAVPPPPPQEVKQETPQRQEPRPAAPTTSAPQAIPEATAAKPAAPVQGPRRPDNKYAVQTWQRQVSDLIARNARYPTAADRRGQTGEVQVSFGIDRQGRVIDSRVVRGSGNAALDEEALSVLRRAQPFPVPPQELPGERVGLVVPVQFVPHEPSPVAKR